MSTSPDQHPRDPDVAGAESQPKKPWTKGRIAVFAGGGCCALLVLAFAAIVILGLIVGSDESPDPEPLPTPTSEQASTNDSTVEPEVEPTTEEATTAEPTTSEPTAEETTEDEAATNEKGDAQAWADDVEQSALLGAADWQELCGGDYSLGSCWITDVSADQVGTLNVTLQLTGDDAEAEALAEGAANTIFTTAGYEHDDLDWVVIYGADGTVITQKQRSDYPFFD